MAFGYGYGGYPAGYYVPPMPDQLAQLRQGQFQTPVMQQNMMQGAQQPPTTLSSPAQQQAQPASMSGPVFVNGEAGAKGYLVGAGNTVMLIDADPDANTFWLKSADAAGMPSMRTFDYTERLNSAKPASEPPQSSNLKNVEYVAKNDFDDLAARCAALERELEEIKNKPCNCKKKAAKEESE